MNNLLTHYPVNWIDGMKLSSSHFYCCAGLCYRIKKQNNELSAMIDKIDERNGYES